MATRLIGKSVDYAFSALQHIVESGGGKVMAAEIAKENDIPEKYLSKILRTLVRAKILKSHYGPSGGYSITRSPEEITFKEIFDAVSGGLIVVSCMDKNSRKCSREAKCTHKRVWESVGLQIEEILRRNNLGDI